MLEQMSQQTNNDESNSLNFVAALQKITVKRDFKPYSKHEAVTYEFTEDPALLHQYYVLRANKYRKVFNLKNFGAEEDNYDKLSHILIARRGNLCLGGCRLTIREGDEEWLLPTEVDEYIFRDLFPEWPLNRLRHAEISRFAVMEDCGESDVVYGLCKAMYDKVTSSNIHYLFVSSTYVMARNWRMISNSFGVKTTRIVSGVHPPDKVLGEDIEWYLTVSDLTEFCHDRFVVENIDEEVITKKPEFLN